MTSQSVIDRTLTGRVLDLVTYAMAGTALAFALAGVFSLLAGYGLPGVKLGLFYVGWLTFGYAAILVFPTSPHKEQSLPGGEIKSSARMMLSGPSSDDEEFQPGRRKEAERTFASTDETKFQRFVQRLPPARFVPIRKADRFSIGVKMMALSLTVLGTSLAMEVVFHVY
ncbi:MAG: DUF7555 family protein [Halanaeroarchaeum sp.]